MKKKGFTLVELLAVIVILAIISLIAIPLIGNVIEKAKIGALESSVNGLVESANMYYANETIKGDTITETIFDFEDGEQVSDKKLEYKGKVYNGKLILHDNGEVAVCIDDEEHYAYKNKDTDEIVSGIGTCSYDGTTGDFSSNQNNDLANLKLFDSNKSTSSTWTTATGDVTCTMTLPKGKYFLNILTSTGNNFSTKSYSAGTYTLSHGTIISEIENGTSNGSGSTSCSIGTRQIGALVELDEETTVTVTFTGYQMSLVVTMQAYSF